MAKKCSIVWFRQDLRLKDHPALDAALSNSDSVIPLYIWSPEEEGKWSPASASQWWLHHSLEHLDQSLRSYGSRLILRQGKALETLWEVARSTGADTIYWNRRYEPLVIERDKEIKSQLQEDGLTAESFNGSLLFEPWEIQTQKDQPFQVYTPFYKALLQREMSEPTSSAPKKIPAPGKWCKSDSLDSFDLLPKIDWAEGIRGHWTPGEEGAKKRLDSFLDKAIGDYNEERDRPDHNGTSSLSPHLHFGEISPRQIWKEVQSRCMPKGRGRRPKGPETFLKEVVWREFAYHLLYHFPETTDKPLREQFSDVSWKKSKKSLRAWQRGKTGYPIVDAGMRQLWAIGWMHNRVRMIVASFLVKHLLIPWQQGAEWFWDTLVDADLANNTLGWQWTAGCGADAAPYFRIFNPILQGERYDPKGDYVSEWVPELKKLAAKWIHKPWEAPKDVLEKAEVKLGETYPKPIVDHKEARERALERYEEIKGK